MQIAWRKQVAKLASAILNPFLVSFAVILLLSFQSASSTWEAIKWSSMAIGFSILPVFVIIVYLVRNEKLEGIFIRARRQRSKIYLLASFFAVVSCVILAYFGAPKVLVASFVAGLLAIVIFMCINLLWKISVHTAFVTASVTILIVVYGAIGAIAAVLLPLIGWSRVELEHHSPAQVAVGAILSSLIVTAVFSAFGLIRPLNVI